MGITLHARVEILQPATEYSSESWLHVSTWRLQKDYALMLWLSEHAKREWPDDFDDFSDSRFCEGRSHIDAERLLAVEPEEWARLNCDSTIWRSLLASLAVWSPDTVDERPCRVLFFER